MTEIRLGDLFPTFSDFEARLKIYKKSKSMDFYISDSRTLELARMRCPNGEALKYYCVKFKCVKGGTFKAKKAVKECVKHCKYSLFPNCTF